MPLSLLFAFDSYEWTSLSANKQILEITPLRLSSKHPSKKKNLIDSEVLISSVTWEANNEECVHPLTKKQSWYRSLIYFIIDSIEFFSFVTALLSCCRAVRQGRNDMRCLFSVTAFVVEGLKVHYRLRMGLEMERREMMTQFHRNWLVFFLLLLLFFVLNVLFVFISANVDSWLSTCTEVFWS